ncbi:Caspase domain-containing protein [Lentzea waywayandensis]|uniref:Caspase domain-containing protein n=1 Tax=Lentzea waywayandensis TaxID=84724 RepID=A0A1I6FIS5_9PSEU|nr:SAV_2336 N-terminal domain-related protein [Lentzea waywayandensis]SFR29853.1 Caspase domain-containing protein [Lentzea waywayandensis]
MLDRLIRGLTAFSADIDAMSVADVLWLARAMQPEPEIAPPPAKPPDATLPPAMPELDSPRWDKPPLEEPEPPNEDDVVAPVQDDETGARQGSRTGLPTGRALAQTLDIARALRPFKQRFLNITRRELSVDDTIEHYVATNLLTPVLVPAKERWFNVDVVVDGSASMAAWDDTVTELMSVLRRMGAFRTVEKWYIDPNQVKPLLHKTHEVSLKPRALRDPRQRRLVIVVSDCVAEGWYREDIWSVLRDWGSATHTLLLNPLPQKLWRRTGLDQPASRLRQSRPGAPNSNLKFGLSPLLRRKPGEPPWLPLPVVGLSVTSLAQWARTAMAKDPTGCDGVLLSPAGDLSSEDLDYLDDDPPDGRELVESFRLTASGPAWRIAVLCANQDILHVRVLRFIQRELVPDAQPADLAEVLTSGLFHEAAGSTPEELMVALRDGVSEQLLTYASTLDTWTLVNALTDYTRSEASALGEVTAVVLDEAGELTVPEHLRPFARAARKAAELLEPSPEPEPLTVLLPEPEQQVPPPVPTADTLMKGRFVGIGVGSYELVQPLPHATSDVRAFGALLRGLVGEPLTDPTEADIRAHMKALRTKPQDGGALVALWSGHAIPVAGNLRLLARDNDGVVDGIMLHEFALWCAASGAHQVLIIIDACYSGDQLDEAVRTVSAIQEELLAGQVHWAGVLMSCSSVETAREGVFGRALRRLLTVGPRTAEDVWRWSDRTPLVDGGAFGAALLNGWDNDLQRPQFMQYGSAQPMLPNPLYRPPSIVKHLLLAARGGDSPNGRSWFSGRTAEVDRVVGWVRSGVPGLRVVTGSPGTGKSALVGRVVSLSNPVERARLYAAGRAWRHTDPGENSIVANVHVRAMDANRVADVISRQMVTAGLIPPPEESGRDAAELVGVLARHTDATPVVVVDGLDEARGESFSIATTLLTRIAQYCTVIVSTRQAHRVGGGAPLLTELSPVEVLDLDDSNNEPDVRAYVLARLGPDAPQSFVDELARLPFLTAWMVTEQVLADGGADVGFSLDAAFDRELSKVPSARALLTALTWSYGAGFPEAEWLAVAEALSNQTFSHDDINAVLTELGPQVLQDSEEGSTVFKLTHQTFADHLRMPFAPSRDGVFAPGAELVANALIQLYRQRMEAGVPPNVPGYLRRYAWRHCGNAGGFALDGLRELAMMNRTLLPDIAFAATTVANELTQWGRGDEAVAPLEEAAEHFRALVPTSRMHLADLAHVLLQLGWRYREAGRLQQAVARAEEAVVRYRELVAATPTTAESLAQKRLAQRIAKTTTHSDDDPTYSSHLSGALVDLSEIYAMLNRRHEALSTARDAVAAVEDGAPLARATMCLAARCRETGLRYEAMQRSKLAVEMYYALSQTNPVSLSALVGALVELSLDYLTLGRLADADSTTQQAAEISGTLGRHAAFRPQLADAALSLSTAYSLINRTEDALNTARQAADLADGLRVHGQALHLLMRRQRDAGKPREAVATGLRAVEVCLLPENAQELTTTLPAALFTLDTVSAGLRQPEIVDETWERVTSRLIGPTLATLLMLRAASARAGDPQAAKWLSRALTHVGQSRQAIHDVHEIARRHYDSGPWPWDTTPDWLTVDRTLLRTARAWVFARTYAEERAFLLSHPELLSSDADVAVTEALYGASLVEAQIIQSRRTTAQQQGVEQAYRPWLLASLADEFVDATPARRRELLATRRDELLDREVLKNVRDNRAVHAMLLLAEEDSDVLDLVLDAQENPELATELLRRLAPAATPQAIFQAVTALEPHPLAALYKVVARVRAGDARLVLPEAYERLAWINELTYLLPSVPNLATLIRVLSAPA